VVSKRITEEGEVLPLYQRDLVVGGDGEAGADGKLFLVWPVIVQHRIDADSPLWDISADDLQIHTGTGSIGPPMPGVSRSGSVGRHHFEILVVLEGIVESTGMTTQARTSYLPHEIQWGHRFERLVRFRRDEAIYVVDYARFHHTVPLDCDVPRESARVQAETAAAEETRKNNNDSKENCDEQAIVATTDGAILRSRGGRNSSLHRKDGCTEDGAQIADDDDDGLSSRSDSPATTASRTLQLAVGVPLAHRAVTPVIGRRRPVGTIMQELSLAAFDLTDECSLNPDPSRLSPAKTDGRRHHPSQDRQQCAADIRHPTSAMTAFSRAMGTVALPPSSPFDLQR